MSVTVQKKYSLSSLAPRRDYRSESGEKLPGVTTVIGVLDKPQLMTWAAKVERESVLAALDSGDPNWRADLGALAFTKKRDAAADAGTVAHGRIEAWLKGMELTEDGIAPETWAASENGFARFKDWWMEYGLQLVASEKVLVSDSLGVGGTLDIVARTPEDAVWLVDIKTSNPNKAFPYPPMKAQVAAYERLWFGINDPEMFDNVVVVRVGKDEKDEVQACWVSVDERRAGWRLFLGALECYKALKSL